WSGGESARAASALARSLTIRPIIDFNRSKVSIHSTSSAFNRRSSVIKRSSESGGFLSSLRPQSAIGNAVARSARVVSRFQKILLRLSSPFVVTCVSPHVDAALRHFAQGRFLFAVTN